MLHVFFFDVTHQLSPLRQVICKGASRAQEQLKEAFAELQEGTFLKQP